MYKGNSASHQRRYKVHEIDFAPVGYVTQDDLIVSADNMSLDECEAERRQLITEKVRTENELAAAKRKADKREVTALGHRLAGYASRLSLLKQRMHTLRGADRSQAFGDAVRDVVSTEVLQQIYDRQEQIYAARIAARRAETACWFGSQEPEMPAQKDLSA